MSNWEPRPFAGSGLLPGRLRMCFGSSCARSTYHLAVIATLLHILTFFLFCHKTWYVYVDSQSQFFAIPTSNITLFLCKGYYENTLAVNFYLSKNSVRYVRRIKIPRGHPLHFIQNRSLIHGVAAKRLRTLIPPELHQSCTPYCGGN